MTWWQFFFLFAAIYLAPRTSDWAALSIAFVMTVMGLFALWKGD
jgi:hypothetical protein